MVTTPSSRKHSRGRDYSAATLLLFLLLVGVGVLTWYWISGREPAPARTERVPPEAIVPAAANATAGNARAAGPATETVYLVESQERATFLRGVLSGANVTQATNDMPPTTASVVVVQAGQDATVLFSEEQRERAKEGLAALTIVDLRPADGSPHARPEGTNLIEPYAPELITP